MTPWEERLGRGARKKIIIITTERELKSSNDQICSSSAADVCLTESCSVSGVWWQRSCSRRTYVERTKRLGVGDAELHNNAPFLILLSPPHTHTYTHTLLRSVSVCKLREKLLCVLRHELWKVRAGGYSDRRLVFVFGDDAIEDFFIFIFF